MWHGINVMQSHRKLISVNADTQLPPRRSYYPHLIKKIGVNVKILFHVWAGLLVIGLTPSDSLAKDAEDFFADATQYTVRIDATISTAFIEDEQGAHHGAGFIVDRKRQWVMTNAHVTGHSPSTLEAIFKDGTRVRARKVYVDPYIDLAIIELLDELPPIGEASLACDHEPGIGHPVGAYGHPWGLNFTGTRGVISGSTSRWGAKLLQTDTPINGGNSGGPLISLKTGKIVGINTSSYNDDDDQNTNFAVPISLACRIVKLLQDGRDPSPPQLLTDFYRTIDGSDGLIVARTFLETNLLPLKQGDEILAVNDADVANESELVHEMRGSLDAIRVIVWRDDDVVEFEGHLNPEPSIIGRKGLAFAGILFANSGFRDHKVLETGHDVMIHSISPGSDADGERLWYYDYVVRVNNEPVSSLDHLNQLLSYEPESGQLQLDFLRMTEDANTGHLFYALRRVINWSDPEQVGDWGEQFSESVSSAE
jgi:S1-C subfamily serine protease